MIEVKHLKKSYGGRDILKDFNCVINDGDIVAVIGPSGCGKSTFIRCLNLLEEPTGGEILFDGKNIVTDELSKVEVRKYAGMVFQGYNLYPQYTVLENIMVPQVDILKRSKQEAYDRSIENLKMVDLYSQVEKYPHQLSGGQKQRVAIARTLAMDNKVLLLDEPTSALDPIMVREVQYVLKKLAKAGKTMILVTHEMRLAKEIANRVFFLTDGILYEEGTPEEIFEHPKKEKTLDFINFVNERVITITPDSFELTTALSEIGAFVERNELSAKERFRIESICEELIVISLLPHLQGGDEVRISLAYSEKTGWIQLDVLYPGTYDPLIHMNEISLKLVNHQATDLRCNPIATAENRMKLSLKINKHLELQ